MKKICKGSERGYGRVPLNMFIIFNIFNIFNIFKDQQRFGGKIWARTSASPATKSRQRFPRESTSWCNVRVWISIFPLFSIFSTFSIFWIFLTFQESLPHGVMWELRIQYFNIFNIFNISNIFDASNIPRESTSWCKLISMFQCFEYFQLI